MAVIIVGIDPGTTTAYAALDENGRIVYIFSAKELGLNELISRAIAHGKVLMLSTDKATPPGFVLDASAKLGAKLFFPEEDLLVKEKRRIVAEYEKEFKTELELNAHELDALASAIFAYRKHKNQFRKIHAYLERKGRPDLLEELMLLVVRNEQLSFDSALQILLRKDEPYEGGKHGSAGSANANNILSGVPKSGKGAGAAGADDASRHGINAAVGKRIIEMEARVAQLEQKNAGLKKHILEQDKLILRLKKKIAGTPRDAVLAEKEKKLYLKEGEIAGHKKDVMVLGKELKELNAFIARISRNPLLKKLDDFGQKEFDAKKFLEIKEGDVLLVKNTDIRSERVLRELREKVHVIITDSVQKNKDGFIYLKPAGIVVAESENYAIADEAALAERLREKSLLQDIISDYKKERKA